MKKLEDYLYYEEKNPDLKIYCGDCLEIMPLLEEVNSVISDPPYGIDFKYDGHDDHPDAYVGGYEKYIMKVWKECEYKVGHHGIISFAQATKNFKNFWKWFGDDIRIFILAKNFVSMRGDIPYAYDPVIIKFIGEPILSNENRRDFFVANMAGVISNTNAIQREHPSPKPLDGIKYLVNAFSTNGSLVLDPFLGSGTTLVACKELGRNGIGIEINPKYCEIAKKRLINTQRMML